MTPESPDDLAPTTPTPPSAHSSGQARFLPGALLANRYRIVALAGRGGMGEVYRADDLKLGQPVALKFLPEDLARDSGRLQQLLGEARIAREISHPNICRVYDVGEYADHHFITMEYIDGEDLGSLLRRIGRLPQEKALDLARQICAGLAAAHGQGIIHRDLKPANIMLDGRGRARITDFGLAAAAEALRGSRTVAGTPGYMAPEQLARGEITTRTDVYALGLLLFEMFTGKRPPERADQLLPRPSGLVGGLDPAIDAAILKCLEKEPAKRPASAVALMALLPGVDPLAAAVSAGETPSPEMVAAAGEEGTLAPAKAWGLLGLTVLAVVAAVIMAVNASGLDKVRMSRTPDSLRDRAREIAVALGAEIPRPHDAWWVGFDEGYLDWHRAHATSLSAVQPAPIRFYFRQSPVGITPVGYTVTRDDPPLRWNGETYIATDPKGGLLEYRHEAAQVEKPDSNQGAPPPVDWITLLALTGAKPAGLRPVAPVWVPDVPFDVRAAWTDSAAGTRIEAAAWNGKPVWLRTISPWERQDRNPGATSPDPMAYIVFVSLVVAVTLGLIVVARHNLKLGRSDRKGALRVGVTVFACFAVANTFQFPWALDPTVVWRFLQRQPAFPAFSAWLYYLGIEPFLRRRWPHRLIAWARLLEGRVADPLVGRELMMGALAGAACVFLGGIDSKLNPGMGADIMRFWFPLAGPLNFWGSLLISLGVGLVNGLGAFATLLLMRLIFRRDVLAWIGVAIVTMLTSVTGHVGLVDLILSVLVAAVFVASMRVGLLCAIAAWSTYFALAQSGPLSVDPEQWYFWRTAVTVGVLLAIAVWGFRAAIGRRRIFSSAILEG